MRKTSGHSWVGERMFASHNPADAFANTLASRNTNTSHAVTRSELHTQHGIEVGHAFHLGTKYSEVFNCRFRGRDGVERAAEMGCYGLGLTRILAAIVCLPLMLRRPIPCLPQQLLSSHIAAVSRSLWLLVRRNPCGGNRM